MVVGHLETMSLLWPLACVLRVGERRNNAPGKLIHAMFVAEDKLDVTFSEEQEGSYVHTLTDDIRTTMNRNPNGLR